MITVAHQSKDQTSVTERHAAGSRPGVAHAQPLVSVYVPTRNRAELLTRALQSVQSQTYPHIEILVVDDASVDETPALLESLASQGQLRYFRRDDCCGAPAARNLALREATGDLVTGLDDDDVWLPERLERMVAQLKPGVGFVAASDILELDGGRRFILRRPAKIGRDDLLRRNVVGNQVLARRSDVLACGGFDESLPAAQDYDLWIRLAARVGSGVGLGMPLQIIHSQASRVRISTSSRRRSGLWRVFRKHVEEMSLEQRRSHLFGVIRTIERPISLRTALILASRRDAARVAAHYLSRYFPTLTHGVEKIAEWRDRGEVRRALADVQQECVY